MKVRALLCAVLVGLLLAGSARAQVPPAFSVTVDEYGNGSFVDPTGLVLPLPVVPVPLGVGYLLPFPTVPGDLLIFEPGPAQGLSDIIRFQENGVMAFISDGSDGIDAPADVAIPLEQIPLQTNLITALEVGPEGNNYALYSPLGSMPGSIVGAALFPVDYRFISDGSIPLPSTVGMGAVGLGLMGLSAVRRHFKRAA